MKLLFPCLLITSVLAAGLLVGLRPLEVAGSTLAAYSPATTINCTPTALTVTAGPKVMPPRTPASLSPEDELTRALRRGPAADRDRAFNVLLPDLVGRDPALAGHLALTWEPGALRDEFLGQFIRQWAATDLGAVITWVTSLLNETDRQSAARAAAAQVAQDDPAGAIELAQLLHVGVDDGSLEHIAQLWTEENPREAVDWIVRRPADPVRDRLLARVAWTRAQSDPAEAASLVLNQMTPGDARDEALLGVVRQWAGRDPAPATAWVEQFPSGPLHTRALAALASARQLR